MPMPESFRKGFGFSRQCQWIHLQDLVASCALWRGTVKWEFFHYIGFLNSTETGGDLGRESADVARLHPKF